MATTTNISSNYAGEVAGDVIGKAFLEADTLAKKLVTVLPKIKYEASLRKIEYGNGRVDYSCGFTPSGSVMLKEVKLTPKKIKNQSEICKEDLTQIWSSQTMGFSAHNDSMPKDVQTALLNEILGDTAEATDMDMWQGDAVNTGSFDGFIKGFTADATVVKHGNGLTALGAPIDKTNVVSEFEKVTGAIPRALRRKKDLMFIVSPDVELAYQQSLISPQITNGLGGETIALKYGSFNIETVNGLPDNTIVIYQRKNLYFGTGLESDLNEIRIKDMDESDLSGMVRYSMVYTGGTQHVNGKEIVWYLSTAV